MNIGEKSLLGLLTGYEQFTVPIYQRPYSWRKKDCEQLLKDIIRVEEQGWDSYFLGTIVCKHERSSPIRQSLIIDGQQRLATLSLLLYALGRAIEANNVEKVPKRAKIEEDYLFNRHSEGDDRYRLLLTKHDRDILFDLLDDEDCSQADSLLVKNYIFFRKELEHLNLKTVYEGIQKLKIIEIELMTSSENPQVIFENLNSKGRELTQADLIRNYVFMGQEIGFQNKLYNKFWYPMEESFDEKPVKIDTFIRHYLTLKIGECPPMREVYESFKRFIPSGQPAERLETQIGDIDCYSKYYLDIRLPRPETEQDLGNCLKDILDLKIESVFPLLLGVYEGYKKELIAKQEVDDIFRLVESYMFRRIICGLKPIADQTVADLASKLAYTHGCFHILRGMFPESGTHRFPSDSEVKQHFPIKRFTESSSRYVNYLLGRLENCEREKERAEAKQYTIEHIMPVKLTKEWIEELDENYQDVHNRLLHTIGNLTLTGYNPELSNRTFQEKMDLKPGGFRDSRLHLNRSLLALEKWNEGTIEKRAEELTTKALSIWGDHGKSYSFDLDKNSLLYKDMEDILERMESNQVRLYTHAEVWNE